MSSPPATSNFVAFVCSSMSGNSAAGVILQLDLVARSSIYPEWSTLHDLLAHITEMVTVITWAASGACITPGTSLLSQGSYTRSPALLSLQDCFDPVPSMDRLWTVKESPTHPASAPDKAIAG